MSRRSKRLLWAAIVAFSLAATFAAATFSWRWAFAKVRDDGRLAAWVNRRPEKTRVEWESVESRWPGRFEVRGLRVAGRTERRLWEVRADEATASLALTPLLRRELRFDRIRARGVSVRAAGREQDTPTTGPMARLPRGTKPSIGGFPTLPLPLPASAKAPWSFVFDDALVEQVREIWLDDRILRGEIDAGGGFELRRRETATIYPTRIDLRGATAWVGGEVFGRDLSGSLRFTTAPYPYRGVEVERVLRAITGELSLTGDLETDPFVDALLAPWPTLEIDSGGVSARGQFVLRRGRLAPGSRLELREPRQRIRFLGFEASGDAELEAVVRGAAPGPTLQTVVQLGNWQLGRPGEAALLLGEGLEIRSTARHLAWGERPQPLGLEIDLGSGQLPDLGFLNDYLPPAADTRIAAGTATLRGSIRIAGSGEEGSGEIAVRAESLRLETRGQRLEGKLEADVRLSRPDLEHRSFSLADTRLMLRDLVASTSAGGRVAGWWGEVRLSEARVDLDRPVRIAGAFRARLADTRPLVAFYEVKRDLPSWAERLLTLEGVSASGSFDWAPGRFELERSEVPLPRGELRTKLLLDRDRRLGKLLARWRRLSLGVEIDGPTHRLHLRNAEDWYDEPGFSRLPPP